MNYTVSAIQQKRKNPHPQVRKGRQNRTEPYKEYTSVLGKKHEPDHLKCQARRNDVCRQRKKWGEYQKVCKSSVKVSGIETTENTPRAFIAALGTQDTQPKDPWEVSLKVNEKLVRFNIGTGAEVTLISSSTWRAIGSPHLHASNKSLLCPDKHRLDVQGMFKGILKGTSRQTDEEII